MASSVGEKQLPIRGRIADSALQSSTMTGYGVEYEVSWHLERKVGGLGPSCEDSFSIIVVREDEGACNENHPW
jgi:hypothetical protein